MVITERTQTLFEFSQSVNETVERLNRTNEPEYLTIDGEPRAVIISPAVYDELKRELLLANDVAVIKQSFEQIDRGEYMEANAFFDKMRQRLLDMQATQANEDIE